jgi:predicted glycogen debranching enzyme
MHIEHAAEWLEADLQGGFASGTVSGERTRRYHALLLTATLPPSGRVALVNGFEAWVETDQRYALSTQQYASGVVFPEGFRLIVSFDGKPWPTWVYRLPDGIEVTQEILVHRKVGDTILRWRAKAKCRLIVRPLLSFRDYHSLTHENRAADLSASIQNGNVVWRLYRSLPSVTALSNGTYRQAPVWYRDFLYGQEQARGLDHIEDLAAPGEFAWELGTGDAVLVLRAGDDISGSAVDRAAHGIAAERARRDHFATCLEWAGDEYLVDRSGGRTLIAGYPWFTDWGRDTFIAMRGLMLVTGRLDDAEAILLTWADTISEGMLPNRFPDSSAIPEYNSVDSALWFAVAAHEFLAARSASTDTRSRLQTAIETILDNYVQGTRFAIRVDEDGLVAAGVAGSQLTWMDAKVGDVPVTPRIGKPVEIQALWLNALRIAAQWSDRYAELTARAHESFLRCFLNGSTGGLFDVIDVDHRIGVNDGRVRPNQIFAVGGLPFPILDGSAARSVVDLVEAKLVTPLGLRSLSPDDPGYIGIYNGSPEHRDRAYHEGTAWPWLMGPFVDAWLRVRGCTDSAKSEARMRFLEPLMQHLHVAGLGHVSEVADGDPPHTPGGCPFQAWSLGELIRICNFVETDADRAQHRLPSRSHSELG